MLSSSSAEDFAIDADITPVPIDITGVNAPGTVCSSFSVCYNLTSGLVGTTVHEGFQKA
jgi:hypothetical protein